MSVNVRPSTFGAQLKAVHYAAISPSDTVNFADGDCDAIYVGGAGIVQVVRWDDTVVPFTASAGTVLNIHAKRVNNTSGSATLMVAMYVK